MLAGWATFSASCGREQQVWDAQGLHRLHALPLPCRADPNLLWLHYEDLIEDRAACIKLIADFIRVGHDDPELQDLAVEQSDINFMKQVGGSLAPYVGMLAMLAGAQLNSPTPVFCVSGHGAK